MQETIAYNPFAGPVIEKIMNTTQSQAEIWIACKFGGNDANRAYNESMTLVLEGKLNDVALDKAIQKVIERHEALRAVFSPDGRFMVVREFVPLQIQENDYSKLDSAEQRNKISDYLNTDANFVFDLAKGPLLKIGILRLSESEHRLIITAHHIICDGWSIGTILKELGSFYSSYVLGKVDGVPEPDDYSVYSEEMERFAESEDGKETVHYWLKQYEASIPNVRLPIDFPRPQLRTYKSKQLDFTIDNDLIDNLKKVGVKSGASFVVTLMAAYEVFLSHFTGQKELVLGLSAAGQSVNGKIHLVGHCVNLLPLRSKIDSNFSFKEYVKKRKTAILDAYDHQQFSFGQLLQELAIARDPSRVPLVPITFNIDMGMANDVAFEGLTFRLKSNPRNFEAFELFLNIAEESGELVFQWSYNTSLFKASTIEKMMSSFIEVLQVIVADPDIEIGTISTKLNQTITSSPDSLFEKANLLDNDHLLDGTDDSNLVDLFVSQAKKTPNNTAVVFESKKITYRELDSLSNQFANYLVNSHDIKVNDLVCILLERSEWRIICIMGILKAGAAYVPIEPSYPDQRKNYIIKDSRSKIVIDIDFVTNFIHEQDGLSPQLDHPAEILPESLSYIIYTSGTTGNPKGVMIQHKNVVNLIAALTHSFNIDETEHILQFTNYCFDPSVEQTFLALLNGAALFMIDKQTLMNNQLPRFLAAHEITHLHATPSYLETLPDLSELKSLKRIVSGGEVCPLKLAQKLGRICDFYNKYGPTEATVTSTLHKYLPSDDTKKSLSIGRAIANAEVYILSDDLTKQPVGQVGEICIAGRGLGRGYLNLEDRTKQSFVDNPFEPGTKLYRTGDHGILMEDGNIDYVGRKDDQVKIRGYRIELKEIQAALEAFPSVKRSFVTTYKSSTGDQSIVAYMQPNTSNSDSKELKKQLGQIMPEFQIPSDFIWIDKFPLTTNGKIDSAALPKPETTFVTTDYNEPSTSSEKIIAKIWEDCLGLEKLGVNSDFFEIGGHSLVAFRVMSQIETETGNRLPLVSLLEHPTVSKLAAFMDSKYVTWDSLVPLKPDGSKPPLYIVHGAHHNVVIFNELAQNLDDDQPVFALQARGLDGKAEPHDSMYEMAADYLKEVIAANPTGPYCLAGFSLGGTIAFEMARQLREQGKKVKMVAMFDTNVLPNYYFDNPLKKKIVSKANTLGKIGYALFDMLRRKKIFKWRMELIKLHLKGFHLRYKYGREKQHEMQFHRSLKMELNHNKATSEYTIVPQDIVVDLFKAEENINFVHDSKFLGWKSFAKKGVRRHMVKGNHIDMFDKGYVEDFAEKLQYALDYYDAESLE